jgi:hypothetical protein
VRWRIRGPPGGWLADRAGLEPAASRPEKGALPLRYRPAVVTVAARKPTAVESVGFLVRPGTDQGQRSVYGFLVTFTGIFFRFFRFGGWYSPISSRLSRPVR